MVRLPTGTVTFLFTDIEASTRVVQDLGDSISKQVFADHRRLLVEAVKSGGGNVYQDQGESFLFVFPRAKDAVLAAVVAQRALWGHTWPEGEHLRVRMGLHTGEPVGESGEYVGLDVHRAARICAAGHGGQIILSQATYVLVADDFPDGAGFRDLGQHRLKDLTRPQRLFQVVVPGLPIDFPALRSLDVLPNNLPVQLTSFIGREREKAEVKRLLSTARLVTLTGSGGAGKTRLALQVAAEVLEEFKDGVWVAELASLSAPALVPNTVIAALGLPEPMGRPPVEMLADYLRPRSLLLLLDNCEHLLPACAGLAETLLRDCATLRILATSREALDIDGEVAYRVPSLSFPEARPLPLERLAEFEAVRLFIDRATAALPRFAVTTQNAKAVATICQRLDGIPLAIELAAARVKALSVEHIAERLHDRFRLLTSGRRTALPRHQTLRAAMDWSYGLLTEPERVLLRRLSVFAGGFALETAEAVCQGQGVNTDEVVDLLTHLVEKSLVVFEERGERYRLLETVRQYGLEKLLESGEDAEAHRKHRDWCLELAEQAEPELRGPRQREWVARLEAEHDNLRAALEWSKTAPDGAEAGLRLAGALWWFWYGRGYLGEGRGWLEGALVRSDEAPASVVCKPLGWAALFAWRQGDYGRATALSEKGLVLCRELGSKDGMAWFLFVSGLLAQARDYGQAMALLEDGLALDREVGDKWFIAGALAALGIVADRQGDHERATTYLEESLHLMRELGDDIGLAWVLENMGRAALHQGDYGRAAVFLVESLALSRELGVMWIIEECLDGLAGVATGEGRYGDAARLFGAAEVLRETLGLRRSPAHQTVYEQRVTSTRARLGDEAFTAAWAEGRSMTLEQAMQNASKKGRIMPSGL